jgi:DNA-binding LacI/PurR family transcriptional regulator
MSGQTTQIKAMNNEKEKVLAVITASVSWERYKPLAKLIEDEAGKYGYTPVFYNMADQPGQLDALLKQLQADGYLVSRQVIALAGGSEAVGLKKPLVFLDDQFLRVVTARRIGIPALVRERALSAVKDVCAAKGGDHGSL